MNPSNPGSRTTCGAATACWRAAILLLAAFSLPIRGQERPNILFIMADDLGPWAMGCAEDAHPGVRTPNLDRLREGGAMLSNCYSPTAVCSPARASLLTSRYGTEVGILGPIPEGSEIALNPALPTWPRLLAEAGYSTALVGKHHVGEIPAHHPTRLGYQEFAGFLHGGRTSRNPRVEIDGKEREISGWTPDILTDRALDFIRRQRHRPWALSLHFWAPHANTRERSPDGDRTWLPLSDADWELFRETDPRLPEPDYPKLDVPRTRRMLREYLGSVHSVDRGVGRVLDLLDELGLAANTVVIFTSDHGFNVGHHAIWHKGNGRWLLVDNPRGSRPNLWDTSLRVPALVRWPGRIPAGSTVRATISHLDWFPTIAAVAGVPMPSSAIIRGRNVRAALLGTVVDWPDEFYAQQSLPGATMRAFQTARWKVVRFFRPEIPDEFYDRLNDPGERSNLMSSTDPVVRRAIGDLDRRLHGAMVAIDDPAVARWPHR